MKLIGTPACTLLRRGQPDAPTAYRNVGPTITPPHVVHASQPHVPPGADSSDADLTCPADMSPSSGRHTQHAGPLFQKAT